MAKYRHKPVVVEAWQWHKIDPYSHQGVVNHHTGTSDFYVVTIHGQRAYLEDGDWVIEEHDGVHHYPCKPGIFAATYEPVEELVIDAPDSNVGIGTSSPSQKPEVSQETKSLVIEREVHHLMAVTKRYFRDLAKLGKVVNKQIDEVLIQMPPDPRGTKGPSESVDPNRAPF